MKIKSFLLSFLLLGVMITSYAQDAYIGEIRLFAGNFPPKGWAFCNGQMLSVSQNTALFSILGTTYGGNGMTTFALPDLRGRVPVHVDNVKITLGETGGSETTVINPAVSDLKTSGVSLDTKTTGRDGAPFVVQSVQVTPMGNPQVVDNRPPYLGLNYIICMYGLYPMRD